MTENEVAKQIVDVAFKIHTAYGPGSYEAGSHEAGSYRAGPEPDRPQPDAFRAARRLFWIATASALFACVDFYFQFPAPAGYGPQFIWLDSGVYRRAQGLFYEASTLGNFCAFFLVMIAVALARTAQVRSPGVLDPRGGG